MKCKLTNSEMDIMANMVDAACDILKNSNDVHDKMYLAVFEEVRISIEQKLILRSKEYRLKLKPYQAIAFWLCFNKNNQQHPQIRNLIRTVCDAIHKEHLVK